MNTKIAIASTLKPVIDPRAYEKIGKTLAESGQYEVHILGSSPTNNLEDSKLFLHNISNTNGILRRILLPITLLVELLKIKPKALIITTHELLVIGVFFKLYSGCKLLYDIQENYYFNLIYQKNYPKILRYLLAIYVRTKEILLANFMDHFLLAEKCYAQEIKFLKHRYTILENKYKAADNGIKKQQQSKTEFLLSGTISRMYGVFEALHFFSQLPASEYKLVIIGHCSNRSTFNQLKKEIADVENIDFHVSLTPIPQSEIHSKIGNRTIGLLPYQANKSTENKIPTKLYEYIGLGVPILISANPIWSNLIDKYQAGIIFDFHSTVNIDDISKSLTSIKHNQSIDLKDIMWNIEETKLLALMEHLLFTKKKINI